MSRPTIETRLSGLLIRWEELRRLGRHASPEELCSDCPELIDELRERIQLLEAMDPVLTTGSGAAATEPPSPSPRLASAGGSTCAGYEILGELGRGGMGLVYRAFDHRRKQLVALKTIRRLGPVALDRFKREFRALADVAHPNLVTLHELVSDGRDWFLTMELVEGVDFLSYIRGPEASNGGSQSSGLTPPQFDRLREALGQLAAGVEALHRAGKLHRDLKPSNVLVTSAGRLVLLDFGLVAELTPSGDHLSTEQHVLGTAAYMAPEQATGLPVGPAADWYSVGVMLYEALTGRLPFRGAPLEMLAAKQGPEPPAPSVLVPTSPEDLDALCAELLRRDAQSRPAGPEILRRVGGRRDEPEANVSLQPPPRQASALVGRQRHLRALDDAFATVQQGQTVVFFIHGNSGAGKTALAQRFLEVLSARGAAVILAGRCYERELVPYKALDSLVDALAKYLGRLPVHEARELLPRDVLPLARVFPVLRRVEAVAAAPGRAAEVPDPHELRRRAFAALRELLGRLGDRRSLMLFIDDLQWGDVDSAQMLIELLRPPDPPVLLLLGTYRDEDEATSPFLRTLREEAPALVRRGLAVESLGRAEAIELALELLGPGVPASEAIAEQIARESGGSPFFVHELVRSFRSHPAPSGLSQIALDQVVLDRVGHLSGGARRLLEVIAVAGRPIDRWHAMRAVGLEDSDHIGIELLRAGRLIRGSGSPGGDQVETYHDRIREAVAGGLTPEAREACHLRLAESLEAVGGVDPEFLAVHFRAAGDRRRAVSYCVMAAERATQALAFDAAARLYKEALGLEPPVVDQVRQLRTRLGDALANAGRGAEAAENYLAAAGVEGIGPDQALDLRQKAAKHLLMSGNIDEGLAVLNAVLGGIGVRSPRTTWGAIGLLLLCRLRVRLRGTRFQERDASRIAPEKLRRIDLCESAAEGLGIVDYIRGGYFHSVALLDTLRVGEPHRVARLLAFEATRHSSVRGLPASRRTERLLRAAESIAERFEDFSVLGILYLNRGVSAYLEGRWLASYEKLVQAEETLQDRCVGMTWELDTARTFLLWSLTYPGRLSELRRRHGKLLREAKDRGDLYAMVNLGTYIMAVVGVGSDQPAAAREELLRATRQWSQKGFHVQHHNALLARGLLDLYEGQGREAWAYLSAHEHSYRSSLLGHVQQVRVDATQLRARCALGAATNSPDPGPFLRAATKDAGRLERERAPWANALAPLIRAGIAARRGDQASAANYLTEAMRRLVAVDMEIFAHAARRRLGAILGGDQGRDLAAEADSWMSTQGIRNPDRIVAAFAPGFPD